VYITIARTLDRHDENLFSKRYHIQASDLRWNIQWVSDCEVMIEFFDYGSGHYHADPEALSKQQIMRMSFTYQTDADVFVESN
jgi:hypothetical protein